MLDNFSISKGFTMRIELGKSMLASALLAVAAIGTSLALAGSLAAVDVKQGAAMQSSGALLLDVREADEYAQGHAPGSTLIPLSELERRLQEIGGYKNKPVALICRSGNRSGQAQRLLEKAGFNTTVNIAGGMIAWKKAGLPVVAGATSR
jgi:rhodanese-related sulfurtransferase